MSVYVKSDLPIELVLHGPQLSNERLRNAICTNRNLSDAELKALTT